MLLQAAVNLRRLSHGEAPRRHRTEVAVPPPAKDPACFKETARAKLLLVNLKMRPNKVRLQLSRRLIQASLALCSTSSSLFAAEVEEDLRENSTKDAPLASQEPDDSAAPLPEETEPASDTSQEEAKAGEETETAKNAGEEEQEETPLEPTDPPLAAPPTDPVSLPLPPSAGFPEASPGPAAVEAPPAPQSPAAPPVQTPVKAPASESTTSPAEEPPSPPSSSSPHQDTTPVAAPEEQEKFDGGLYFDLNFAAVFGLGSTHEWKTDCPSVTYPAELTATTGSESWNPTCRTTKPVGGMLWSNLGFRFGIFGIEGFGFFSGDFSSGKLEGEEPAVALPSYARDMQVGRLGGALGGGIRVMNNHGIRVSAGVGGGVVFRHVYSNVSSLDGSSEGYQSPVVRADLTLSLGKFFNLGVMGWVEFSKTIAVTPKLGSASSLIGSDPAIDSALTAIEEGYGQVTVFRGAQYFIAPYLGFHFGK